MTYSEALSHDEHEWDDMPDSARELRLGLDAALEPTPEGSRLDHTGSLAPTCMIHSFAMEGADSGEPLTFIQVMRVGVLSENGWREMAKFFTRTNVDDWVEVPTRDGGSREPRPSTLTGTLRSGFSAGPADHSPMTAGGNEPARRVPRGPAGGGAA